MCSFLFNDRIQGENEGHHEIAAASATLTECPCRSERYMKNHPVGAHSKDEDNSTGTSTRPLRTASLSLLLTQSVLRRDSGAEIAGQTQR